MLFTYFMTIITAAASLTVQMSGIMPTITANDVQGLVEVCQVIDGDITANADYGYIRCTESDGDFVQLNINTNAMVVKADGNTQVIQFTEEAPSDSDVYVIGEDVYVRQ